MLLKAKGITKMAYKKEEIEKLFRQQSSNDTFTIKSNKQYENVYLDSDDYEIEFYSDDVVLEDVVFASEDKEVEITDEDMENYLNKKQIREMLQTNYPNASLEEVVYWTQLLYKKHDISTISGDLIRREIWLDKFKKVTFLQKIKMLIKMIKQKSIELFKKDDLDIPF